MPTKIIFITYLILTYPVYMFAEVYKYSDNEGVIHFTNVPTQPNSKQLPALPELSYSNRKLPGKYKKLSPLKNNSSIKTKNPNKLDAQKYNKEENLGIMRSDYKPNPNIDYKKSKARDWLHVINTSWSMSGFGVAQWVVKIKNFSAHPIKDIHFKLEYFAESGTILRSGEETVYTIIQSNEIKTLKLKEISHSQSMKASAVITEAKWPWEEGKVYLDW